jgi:hypothetical protein
MVVDAMLPGWTRSYKDHEYTHVAVKTRSSSISNHSHVFLISLSHQRRIK